MHLFTNFHPPQYFVIISAIIVRLPVKKFKITQLQASLWFHKYFKQSGEQAFLNDLCQQNVIHDVVCVRTLFVILPWWCPMSPLILRDLGYLFMVRQFNLNGKCPGPRRHRFPCWQDFLVLINKCTVLTWKSKSTTNIYFGKPQESF